MQFRRAMHNYFQTMDIPIRRGRGFDPTDSSTAPPVAIINETMASKLSESGSDRTLEEEPQPEMYINYLRGPPIAPFIVMRTTRDPATLAELMRAEMRRIDKNVPLYDMCVCCFEGTKCNASREPRSSRDQNNPAPGRRRRWLSRRGHHWRETFDGDRCRNDCHRVKRS